MRTLSILVLLASAPFGCTATEGKDDEADTDTDTDTDADTDSDSDADGEASATRIIDGVTYEFGLGNIAAETCDSDVFGIFHAVMYSEDLVSNFGLELPGDGVEDETPRFEARIDGVGDFVADETESWPAVTEGDSAVTSFSIDGLTATGTASAIDEDQAWGSEAIEPVDVTFTVTCAK